MSQCGAEQDRREVPEPGVKTVSASSLAASKVISVRQATPALQPLYASDPSAIRPRIPSQTGEPTSTFAR